MRRVIIKSQDQIIILRTSLIMLITANLFLFCIESPLIHSNEGLALQACWFFNVCRSFCAHYLTNSNEKKKKQDHFLSNKPLSVPALLSTLEGRK